MTPERLPRGEALVELIGAYCLSIGISRNSFCRRAGFTTGNLRGIGAAKFVGRDVLERICIAFNGGTYERPDPSLEIEEMRRRSDQLRSARRPGETIGDMIRRIGREVDEEEGIESSDYRDVRSPSALIQRAQREWPEQDAAVRAYAIENGLHLGDAWRRVIEAGVRTVR